MEIDTVSGTALHADYPIDTQGRLSTVCGKDSKRNERFYQVAAAHN